MVTHLLTYMDSFHKISCKMNTLKVINQESVRHCWINATQEVMPAIKSQNEHFYAQPEYNGKNTGFACWFVLLLVDEIQKDFCDFVKYFDSKLGVHRELDLGNMQPNYEENNTASQPKFGHS